MQKRRKNKQAQEETRFRVCEYLKRKMGTQKQAALIFGLTERSVNKIFGIYKNKGKRGLVSRKRGVQTGKKITGEQAFMVRKLIKEKLPDQLKLPYGLWTREAVQRLIHDKFGVELSRWQVGRYLRDWGYTPQKPIGKAFEQKPERVQAWLETEYPDIQAKSKKENAIIYFGDETGMKSDHQAGRSYAPKGETPTVKRTGQRFSLNMISAISNRGHLQFMIIDGRFNGDVFITFLKQMIRYSERKVYFITDGHPAHKTKKLNDWLEENKKKIELFFLPPYSPELNPQEYVNQDLKTNVIGKKRPINKAQMKSNVNEFMNKRKKDKRQVQKYFHEKHVRYAA
jgi:transposase